MSTEKTDQQSASNSKARVAVKGETAAQKKAQKLSKALRENLLKRKQQSRARNTPIRKFDK